MKLLLKKIYIFSFPYSFYKYNPYYTFFFSHKNLSFILHIFRLFIARAFNILFFPKKDKYTKFFLKNGFYKTHLKENEYVHKLYNYLDTKINENDIQKKNICLLSNFSFSKEASLADSQIHISNISKKIMEEIDSYLRNNIKFNNIILNYFKCDYRIVNVRLWRYLSNDNQKLNSIVDYHYDGFPHKTLKIMAYKGNFSKKNSAIDFGSAITNNVEHSIVGKNPIFIFDSNHIYHKADFPIKDRDTIEITIQPTIFKKTPLYGGYCAGYPLNPFKKNEKKISLH